MNHTMPHTNGFFWQKISFSLRHYLSAIERKPNFRLASTQIIAACARRKKSSTAKTFTIISTQHGSLRNALIEANVSCP